LVEGATVIEDKSLLLSTGLKLLRAKPPPSKDACAACEGWKG